MRQNHGISGTVFMQPAYWFLTAVQQICKIILQFELYLVSLLFNLCVVQDITLGSPTSASLELHTHKTLAFQCNPLLLWLLCTTLPNEHFSNCCPLQILPWNICSRWSPNIQITTHYYVLDGASQPLPLLYCDIYITPLLVSEFPPLDSVDHLHWP